ncbi:MAG TPA: GspMb/PilO family protein [Terriglobales bacterium]|jgi:O-methyltransferase involved in polyketide biosynthesis
MPDLKKTRRTLWIAVGALLVVDAVAVAGLLTPLAGSASSRQQQIAQLRAALQQRREAPWRGLDKKVPEARQEIQDFYRDRFPGGYSVISGDLDRIGAQSGVKITSEKYEQKDAQIQGLQRIQIQADVSGDYLQLVKFINSLERSKLFFIVDDLALGGEQSGTVKLQMKLETYLRTVS